MMIKWFTSSGKYYMNISIKTYNDDDEDDDEEEDKDKMMTIMQTISTRTMTMTQEDDIDDNDVDDDLYCNNLLHDLFLIHIYRKYSKLQNIPHRWKYVYRK